MPGAPDSVTGDDRPPHPLLRVGRHRPPRADRGAGRRGRVQCRGPHRPRLPGRDRCRPRPGRTARDQVRPRVAVGGMHVLVYFVEDGGSPLVEELGRLRIDRHERNLALAERLAALGVPVTYEMAVAEAGTESGVGRPHFATAMVAVGAAASVEDAFDRYLANGRPAYVPKARLSGPDVARLARASGGVAVLAHPYSTGLEGPELARLV